jgi:predicted amidohydrolase YtcJ
MVADADLVIYNAKIIGRNNDRYNCLLVKGNRIAGIGGEDLSSQHLGAGVRTIDCQGATLAPGFIDAHCHPVALAKTFACIDCKQEQVESIGQLLGLIIQHRDEGFSGWLRYVNYDEYAIAEGRLPYSWELDLVSDGVPVMVTRNDGQQSVLNSTGNEICGISNDGYIHAHEADKIARIPPLTEKELLRGLRKANELLLSNGITSVHDTSWTNGYGNWCDLQEISKRGLLQSRLHFLPGVDHIDEMTDRGLSTGAGDISLNIGPAKIALDESTGQKYPPQGEITEKIENALARGFGVALHCSDELLLDLSLEALEDVRGTTGRIRLEHCPVVSKASLRRMAGHDIVIISQPNFIRKFAIGESEGKAFDYQAILTSDIQLAFSTDAPLGEIDIPEDIYMLARNEASGRKLHVDQIISAYTRAGAYAAGEERIKGEIRPGRLADLVILDGNIQNKEDQGAEVCRIMHTIIDGKVVWSRGAGL